jgi:GxxExxY protein
MQDKINKMSNDVVGAAIKVHRELGPGLLESAYEACLAFELGEMGFAVERQKELPVVYRGVKIDCGYRLDLVVENTIVLELKTVGKFLPVHDAQLLSYLKLAKMPLGFLINFHVPLLKDGIKRMVNNF